MTFPGQKRSYDKKYEICLVAVLDFRLYRVKRSIR
jgi:hypothetical protein